MRVNTLLILTKAVMYKFPLRNTLNFLLPFMDLLLLVSIHTNQIYCHSSFGCGNTKLPGSTSSQPVF